MKKIVSVIKTGSLSIALLVSGTSLSAPVQPSSYECQQDECAVVDGEIIIKVGFGYAVKIVFAPDTPQDIIAMIGRAAQDVVNNPKVQREAGRILVTAGAYAAAAYVMNKIIDKVGDEVILSVRLIRVY